MPEESHKSPGSPGGDDAALSALNRRARPQPKPFDAPPPPESPLAGSGSATGFVSSLAKSPHDTQAGDSVAGIRPPIPLAKEVSTPRGPSPLAQIAAAAEEAQTHPDTDISQAPPRSSAGMAYAMIGIALLLLIIGSWAVGALVYMYNTQPLSPRDVNYPFIRWQLDLQKGGAYASSSVAMAWAMLLCLPVGTVLLMMGWKLRPRQNVPIGPADARSSL